MNMTLVRQQKYMQALELRNKALVDEHQTYAEYVNDLEK